MSTTVVRASRRRSSEPAHGRAPARARAYAGGLERLRADRYHLADDFQIGPSWWSRARFALTQWLLGLGGGAGAPMRAWHRRYKLSHLRRMHGVLGTAWWLLRDRYWTLQETRRVVARFGPACEAHFGVPRATQLRDLLWLRLVGGVHWDTYYQNQLWRPERRRIADRFLQNHESMVLMRVLAYRAAPEDYLLLEDKRRSECWCREHGIPTPETLVELVEGAVVATAGGRDPVDAIEGARGADLFSKPVDLTGGQGTIRWRWHAGRWHDEAGVPHDAAALLARLASEARADARLLQRALGNHPALTPVSGGALCTARIVTARPPDGAPEITAAAFRTGIGGSSTDNLHRGGIAVAIDRETGRLRSAVQVHPELHVLAFERHPDTDVPFAGFQLPFWAEARALVLRAHALLPRLAIVGWDVAFTPDGPVIVEGNFAPEPRLSQAPGGDALGLSNHVRWIDAQLRRSYERGR